MIIKFPVCIEDKMQQYPERTLRDYAAVPTNALTPYFRRLDLVEKAIRGRKNPFIPHDYTFIPDFKCKDEFARYLHLDLSETGDRTGICMSHVWRYSKHVRPHPNDKGEVVEFRPHVKCDFYGAIQAPPGQEIKQDRIFDMLVALRDELGFDVALITMDKFQSTYLRQRLEDLGFVVARMSIDRCHYYVLVQPDPTEESRWVKESTNGDFAAPMDCLRSLIQGEQWTGVLDPDYAMVTLIEEMEGAERDENSGKVDHSPNSSIDLLQAVAGSCFNAVNNERDYDESGGATTDADYLDDRYSGVSASSRDEEQATESPLEGEDNYGSSDAVDPKESRWNDDW